MPDYGDSAYYWFYEASQSHASRPVNRDTVPRPRARPSSAESDTEDGAQSTGIGGYLLVAALVILVLVGGGSWLGSALTSALNTPASRGDTYSLVGSPTVSADFINRVLTRYHSPAVGEGQAVYNDGVKYGIDPVFAQAFFHA